MKLTPRRRAWDVACPDCCAPPGVACHPVDPDGVHLMSRPMPEETSHPARFHANDLPCADVCDDCPLMYTEFYADEDDD